MLRGDSVLYYQGHDKGKGNLNNEIFLSYKQGSSPLKYLQDYTKDYIKCKLDSDSLPDCPSILNPKKANESSDKSDSLATAAQWEQFREILRDSHVYRRYF